jgi:cytochrome c-type biogenesis protein CcmF
MDNAVNYIGEHLAIGNIGHLGIVLAFTMSILASVAYFFATRQGEGDNSWLKIARGAFFLQCAAVLTVFFSLFYIIYHHYYEYHYAWEHSSNILPTRFMISCFWEGQEGSFLLWIIWQALLGALVIWKAPRSWERPVMAIIALSQVMLTSMILGVLVGDVKFGSSPFTLLRESMDAPIFSDPEYLSKYIQDGNGLNPLLQNNWMVIHPPTLFFGFASTVVPFAFAMAGLWTRRHTEWIKPALPWALISLCILGTGIIMGGMWAYESLSFGGYWNWDPVENASILPWLILAGGLHTMVINKSTRKSAHTAVLLIGLTFLSVLYATFLTRSGVLGDSSVHSFTDLGLSGQLLIWMGLFILGTFTLIGSTWRQYHSVKDEDRLSAREFWMFIGALIFLLSAIHITAVTSIPVYNKIAAFFNVELKMAPPTDRNEAYHFIQIPIAILIAIGSAFTQYLKFKATPSLKPFFLRVVIAAIASLSLGAVMFYYGDLQRLIYGLLLAASLFSIILNTFYVFDMLKGKLKSAGASIAHLGFAMMLVGIIFSSVDKAVISQNNSGIRLSEDEEANAENILLEKNIPVRMREYIVTYLGDSVATPNIFHKVHYRKVDEHDNVKEEFVLIPNTQINPKMGNVANPDTKHYLTHDVFTHVTSAPRKEEVNDTAGIKEVKYFWLANGDTLKANNALLVFDSTEILTNTIKNKYGAEILLGARFTVYTHGGEIFELEPLFGVRESQGIFIDDRCKEAGVVLGFLNVDPNTRKIQVALGEKEPERDFIIMKALVFPFINVLWAGAGLLAIGTFISFLKRWKQAASEK